MYFAISVLNIDWKLVEEGKRGVHNHGAVFMRAANLLKRFNSIEDIVVQAGLAEAVSMFAIAQFQITSAECALANATNCHPSQ